MDSGKIRSILLFAIFILATTICANAQSTQTTPPTPASTPSPPPVAKPVPAQIKLGKLTLSGSLRLRFESWDWFETRAAENSYNFGAATLRLSLGQQLEKAEWQVEGAFPVLIGLPDKAIAPAPQGQLGLGANYFAANGRQDGDAFIKQAFIRFKGIGGDKMSSLKPGRFEFSDGSETTPGD